MDTPPTSTRLPEIQLLPDPNQWPELLRAPELSDQTQARKQLGLPIDRPIVASGHQPIVFHPGIVAKLIAMDAWSKRTGASSVWIVPDQDTVDPALIRIPDAEDGVVSVHEVRLGGEPIQHSPSALVDPIAINPDLPESLEALGSWLIGYEHEPTLARQFASATIGMLCEGLGIDEPILMYASELMGTDAGDAMLDALLVDPKAAIESYNASVERFPDAGVRLLGIEGTRVELPLWRLERDSRVPVFVDIDDIEGFDRANLIPRGLMMTAIMRSVVCDLFIHGTGGYEYDQITQHWINDWQERTIAPIVGASATMRLEFDLPKAPSPARAVWTAHHARHDPMLLGDQSAADQKKTLLAGIEESKSQGDASRTSELFSQLQSLLKEVRSNHQSELERFDDAVEDARKLEASRGIAEDRTWGFPLYSDQQLESLKAEITRALSGLD